MGDEDFVAKATGLLRCGSVREQPPYQDLVIETVETGMVVGTIAQEFGVSRKSLMRIGVNGEIRGIVAELLYNVKI